MDAPSSERDDPRVGRRSVLDWLLGAGVLAWVGSALYPVVRYLKPLPSSGAGGPVSLDPAQQSTLESQRYVIVRAGGERVLVFVDGRDEVRALDARCTHEGCTVQFLPGESIVWCACHDGRFDLDGTVLAGPPPRPLPRFAARRDAEGRVIVETGST